MKFFLSTLPDENAAGAPPSPEFMAASRRFFKIAGDGEGEIRQIMD